MRMPIDSFAPLRVYGPPPVTTILSDSFTDAAGTNLVSHAPEIGGPWSMLRGSASDFLIDNTGAREYAPGTSNPSIIVAGNPPTPNYRLTAVFNLLSNGPQKGYLVRVDGSQNGYGVRFGDDFPGSRWIVYRSDAGAPIGIASNTNGFGPDPHTVVIQMIGTTLTVVLNGATIYSGTQAAYTAAGKPGLTIIGSAEGQTTGKHTTSILVEPL
jgi:hypothetical protein